MSNMKTRTSSLPPPKTRIRRLTSSDELFAKEKKRVDLERSQSHIESSGARMKNEMMKAKGKSNLKEREINDHLKKPTFLPNSTSLDISSSKDTESEVEEETRLLYNQATRTSGSGLMKKDKKHHRQQQQQQQQQQQPLESIAILATPKRQMKDQSSPSSRPLESPASVAVSSLGSESLIRTSKRGVTNHNNNHRGKNTGIPRTFRFPSPAAGPSAAPASSDVVSQSLHFLPSCHLIQLSQIILNCFHSIIQLHLHLQK